MIPPREQWCQQIDVTNACNRACSNCTRLLSHVREPFFMSAERFAECIEALRNFPTNSPPSSADPHKMVGIIGGEPLLHPRFDALAKIMADQIPNREHRGLWTGLEWQKTKYAEIVEEVFGYINNNRHDNECRHSPVLVAIKDVVADSEERRQLISDCWLQRLWSGTCTPRGYFLCEVMGALDVIFDGAGGLPIEPGCWDRPLTDFQEQIDHWCPRCGIPLQLAGRLDIEEVDDISVSNLVTLSSRSPRIESGRYVLHTTLPAETSVKPWRYIQ